MYSSLLTNSFSEGVTSPLLLYSIIANLTLCYANQNLAIDQIINPNPAPFSVVPEYDYIIVGSGSAGGIVAARLSENYNISVLLLEAGGDPLDMNEIPFLWLHNLGQKSSDWVYRTVPQMHSAFSYPNNIIPQPRGKSLGGTSNLNAMVYWRGNPKDFDNWANLTQDDDWSYAKLLPFFKKVETYDGSFEKSPRHHGRSGPIHVTQQNYKILRDEWIAAGREMGFPSVDPDLTQISSFVPCDVSGLNGRRQEIYQGYLNENTQKIRTNLHILRYAHVTRINLNGNNNRAEGVTWTRFGQTFSARAKHEVIISAGAYNSPKLLMLSGIGPREHLETLEINVKINLPGIGENYLDHAATTIGPFLLNDSVSFVQNRDLVEDSINEYISTGGGPLSWNLIQGHGLIATRGKDPTWPNIIFHHIPLGGNDGTLLGPVKEGICEKYMRNVKTDQDAIWAIMFLGRDVKSRGTIRLRSSNPEDPPIIDPNLLAERDDVDAMLEGFKFLVKLYQETEAFSKYNATLIQSKFPGCEQHEDFSDQYYKCYLRHVTRTMYHPTSTCKMGARNDPMAVVDSSLRVYGVKNLRIADASVMPDIPNVNINSATMMLGEKAADLILKDWTGHFYIKGNDGQDDEKNLRTEFFTNSGKTFMTGFVIIILLMYKFMQSRDFVLKKNK